LSSSRFSMTATWEVPESIQTSRVSVPFLVPAGRSRRAHQSSFDFSNQALVPSFSVMSATLRAMVASRMTSLLPAPSSLKKTGRGTPQVRWREIHQSGRASTVPWMRLRPHLGSHSTWSISSSALARRLRFSAEALLDSSMEMKNWSTARKMMGVLERQQWG